MTAISDKARNKMDTRLIEQLTASNEDERLSAFFVLATAKTLRDSGAQPESQPCDDEEVFSATADQLRKLGLYVSYKKRIPLLSTTIVQGNAAQLAQGLELEGVQTAYGDFKLDMMKSTETPTTT